MLPLLLALAFGAVGGAPAVGQPSPPTCDAEEFRQFDFWVGVWTVTQPDGTVVGSNRVERILGGCVIQENWEGTRGSVGTSFNHWDRTDGRWRQTWVDGSGGRLDLVGGLDGERMVLRGVRPRRDPRGELVAGETTLHEIAFTPRGDGTVEQHWRASNDGGETWTDVFLGIYRSADD